MDVSRGLENLPVTVWPPLEEPPGFQVMTEGIWQSGCSTSLRELPGGGGACRGSQSGPGQELWEL